MPSLRIPSLVLALAALLFSASATPAQNANPFMLSIHPAAKIPLGPYHEGESVYSIGASARLTGEYTFPFAPGLYGQGCLEYAFIPTPATTSLSMLSFAGGFGVRFTPMEKLSLRLSALGGYTLAMAEGGIGGYGLASAGTSISFQLTPAFALGLGVTFDYNLSIYDTLYFGIGASLGASFTLGAGGSRSRMELIDIQLDPVFPVFYKYYDDNDLGFVTIRNNENGLVRNVTVSFFAEECMTVPKVCAVIPEMSKDEERRVPIVALFSEDILQYTADTKVSGEIIVEYEFLDTPVSGSRAETLRVYHRNAMTWDDDRKAASFVTANDPQVLQFAKRIAGEIRERDASAVSLKLREAMGLFESLSDYGIKYVVDPASSYAEMSEDEFALDYLQFPTQTFTYRAGDCDDLSICYSALLEAVGTETAFVTVPGHIYVAFNSELEPDIVRRTFLSPDDFIFHDGKSWVPVEVTALQDGFLQAWQSGARQWREHSANDQAVLYPIREAWSLYEAVGARDPAFVVETYDLDAVIESYENSYSRFVEHELHDRIESMREAASTRGNPNRAINSIGVLYARYGLLDKAAVEFRIAADDGYIPALVNLANVFYGQKNIQMAIEYYERAVRGAPENVAALAGLVRSNNDIENLDAIGELIAKLRDLSPETAEGLAHMDPRQDSTARADDVAAQRLQSIIWDEGEESE